jgi:hypothetical protein
VGRNFRTFFENDGSVVDNAEASVDDCLGGLKLVQLIGQQYVALHLEHAIPVSLNLVGAADVLPQKSNSPIPERKKIEFKTFNMITIA